MLMAFHSMAAGEILMFGDVARQLLELMGKEPLDEGVVTVEQLPEAIARLKAVIAEGEPDRDDDDPSHVGLARRAFPLVALLERSLKRGKPVLWGSPP
jgi:hypothetical protein